MIGLQALNETEWESLDCEGPHQTHLSLVLFLFGVPLIAQCISEFNRAVFWEDAIGFCINLGCWAVITR